MSNRKKLKRPKGGLRVRATQEMKALFETNSKMDQVLADLKKDDEAK